jgi:serine protease inhibitor
MLAGDAQCEQQAAKGAGGGKAGVTAAVSANNSFALDLYAKLSAENSGENVFFSPFSVINALTMVAEGARDYTAKEMRQVLHLPEDLVGIHRGLANLGLRYNPQKDTPEVLKTKEAISAQQKALEDIKAEIAGLRKQKKWREAGEAIKRQREGNERLKQLLKQIDPTEITVANALWGEKSYPFRQGYLDKISGLYKTGSVRQSDFKGNFDAERLKINGWAEKQTREKIKDLLPAGSLDRYTRLVLVNAIYFKGEWVSPFKKSDTRNEPFTGSDGSKADVPLMRRQNMEDVRYGAFKPNGSFFNTPMRVSMRGKAPVTDGGPNGFSMIELPYRGGKLAMVVIAPNRPSGLAAVEKQLTSKALAGWLEKLRKRKVHVFVPRFRSETSYKLNEMLQAMGMPSAFKDPRFPGGAKFGGMTTSTDPMQQLYIALVQHKAFVDVDEEGTEAAAATAVAMAVPTSMPMDRPFTPTFRADRPFFYCIRDIETGCILFAGRVVKPGA